jgi:hypothetical protein
MTAAELLIFQAIFCRRCIVKPCRIKSRVGKEDLLELIRTEGYMSPYMCREFECRNKWVMQGVKEKLEGIV